MLSHEDLFATLLRDVIENQIRLAMVAVSQSDRSDLLMYRVAESFVRMGKVLDENGSVDFPPELATHLHASGLRLRDLLGSDPDSESGEPSDPS